MIKKNIDREMQECETKTRIGRQEHREKEPGI